MLIYGTKIKKNKLTKDKNKKILPYRKKIHIFNL